MAGKITDYPTTTSLIDEDLFDLSKYDGVSAYATNAITWEDILKEIQIDLTFNNIYNNNGTIGTGRTATLTDSLSFVSGQVIAAASAAGYASLNIPSGTDPSSPVDGDLWFNGTNLYFRDGATSIDLLGGDGNGIYDGSGTLTANTTVTNAGFDLSITGTGNFGIGTSTPTEKLEVVGNTQLNGNLQVGNFNNSVAFGTTVDSNYNLKSHGGRSWLFGFFDSVGANRLALSNSGGLIGTLTGASRLSFGVPTAFTANQSVIGIKSSSGTYAIATESSTGVVGLVVTANTGAVSIGSIGGSERFNINGITSLINTSAPTVSNTDVCKMWSQDIVAGNAAPHFRTENNDIIKLYKQAALTVSDGTLPTAVTRQGEIETILTNLGLI